MIHTTVPAALLFCRFSSQPVTYQSPLPFLFTSADLTLPPSSLSHSPYTLCLLYVLPSHTFHVSLSHTLVFPPSLTSLMLSHHPVYHHRAGGVGWRAHWSHVRGQEVPAEELWPPQRDPISSSVCANHDRLVCLKFQFTAHQRIMRVHLHTQEHYI